LLREGLLLAKGPLLLQTFDDVDGATGAEFAPMLSGCETTAGIDDGGGAGVLSLVLGFMDEPKRECRGWARQRRCVGDAAGPGSEDSRKLGLGRRLGIRGATRRRRRPKADRWR